MPTQIKAPDFDQLPNDYGRLSVEEKLGRLRTMISMESCARFARAMLATGEFDLEQRDDQHNTLLLLALAWHAPTNAIALLKAGADPTARNLDGDDAWSLLYQFVGYASNHDGEPMMAEIARLMVERGANVNPPTVGREQRSELQDRTPLMLMTMAQCYNAVTMLLDHGADPHITTSNGRSLLHDLMYFHDHDRPQEALRLLTYLVDERGMDVNAMTHTDQALEKRWTPLDVSTSLSEVSVALIERGGRFNQPLNQVVHGTVNQGRVRFLDALRPFCDPNQCLDADDSDPLMSLIKVNVNERDVMDDVSTYLTMFPTTNLSRANKLGHTPLHHAAFYGQAKVVKMLLDAGVSPWALDKKGESPLVEACKGALNTSNAHGLQEAVATVEHLFNAGLTPYQPDVQVALEHERSFDVPYEWMLMAYVRWEKARLGDASSMAVPGARARLRL